MADVTKERDIWVHSFRMPPDSNNSIKMEVGIEDCLHIEFEYNKSKYISFFWLCLVLKRGAQISPEGCDCREDLLPSGPYQDQTYGTLNYSTGDDWCATESI
jgi:hypothetical protein